MMSDYYDHRHRWEALAEFHFIIDEDGGLYDDDNYFYCMCSRVLIRDLVKISYIEKEDASESDADAPDVQSQEWEDQSHVHFSLDTSYKVKCEKDEGASCYCSASHTENYCSTDEHDPAQIPGIMSHALQPSDSGADLTYQDYHSDYVHDRSERMDQDFPTQSIPEFDENYLSEDSWEKFWAINGERLIWASWIKKYSDYINPSYLDQNNELIKDDKNMSKQHSADQIFSKEQEMNQNSAEEETIRERKFSYDSKVNPYKKSHPNEESTEKFVKINQLSTNKEDGWVPIGRRRSCSEHDRMLSPRTLAATDSMTNVTKLTISSYDVTSSHVTSDSTPTDDYSVSSSTSDDPSNDQTRIANVDESLDQALLEESDTEQYWQLLWKKHFGEQYASHYANYIFCHDAQNKDLPSINVEMVPEKKTEEKSLDIECENSEGNSQEMPSVIEVQAQVDQIKLVEEEKVKKPKKKNKKANYNYIGSVGVLLQSLLKEEQQKREQNDLSDAADGTTEKQGTVDVDNSVCDTVNTSNLQQSVSNSSFNHSYKDGDDDAPEEKPAVTLKRSHELDEEEIASENIKSTFEAIGFCLQKDKMPKGELVYRKRFARLRPPWKKLGMPRKTYFDDDGNPIDQMASDTQEEKDMQTDEDCSTLKTLPKVLTKTTNATVMLTDISDVINTKYDVPNQLPSSETNTYDVVLEAAEVPLPPDSENASDVQDNDELSKIIDDTENIVEKIQKKKRKRNYKSTCYSEMTFQNMPVELRNDPKMYKYWKRRYSLFHRFDEGIKMDYESWFSVTPEKVARHIANKCSHDIVVDAFCGAGGNTIQFANTCKHVIAIDIDPNKIEIAKHNASIYGVTDRIEFILGNFFELAPTLKADFVFLSPPWGGPGYSEYVEYDIEEMLEPKPASVLMRVACSVAPNVALYLPRHSKADQLLAIGKEYGASVEIEQSYLDRRLVAITAYFS